MDANRKILINVPGYNVCMLHYRRPISFPFMILIQYDNCNARSTQEVNMQGVLC